MNVTDVEATPRHLRAEALTLVNRRAGGAPAVLVPALLMLLVVAGAPAVAKGPSTVLQDRLAETNGSSAVAIDQGSDDAAIARRLDRDWHGRPVPAEPLPDEGRPVVVQPAAAGADDDAAIDRQLGRVRPAADEPDEPDEPEPAPLAAKPADDAAIARQLERVKPARLAMVGQLAQPPLVVRTVPTEPLAWPFQYARATRAVTVYESPAAGAPIRVLDPTGRWVAIASSQEVDGVEWHELATGGWVPATVVAPAALSTFRGIALAPDDGPADLGFVTTETLNVRRHAGIDDDNEPLTTLERYEVVSVLQEQDVAGITWYRIGDGLWVHGDYVRPIPLAARPEAIDAGEKWIDVNLTRQTLVAYEGDRPVYATLVSSGLPRSPTWQGLSRIWIKYTFTKMSGGDRDRAGDYYWLDHVPYTMYFHGDFGLHAAYWHDDFGRTKSHGCVNLSPVDAAWLFEWTALTVEPDKRFARPTDEEPGTWVWTHS